MLFVRRSIAAFASSTAASGLGQAKPRLSQENITPSNDDSLFVGSPKPCVPEASAKLERFDLKTLIAVH
jgi:hypothetical protein